LLNELLGYKFPTGADELFSFMAVAFGVLVNTLLMILLGKIIDNYRKRGGLVDKNFCIKLPALLVIFLIVMYIFGYIDPSCSKIGPTG